MKLKCRIHEKEYDIVTGATFSEEYNETLDSGSIIIDQVTKIARLKPYDDVYIWNSDQEFYGFINVGDEVLATNVGATSEYTLGASSYGLIQPKTITDYNMPSFMIVNGDYVVFYSHAISDNGRLYPSILDLWLSCFLYSIDLSGTDTRWAMPSHGFPIKLTLTNTQFGTVYGSYKLPPHQEDNVIPSPYSNQQFLKLTKIDSFSSSANAPDILYVAYDAKVCPIGGVTMVTQTCFSIQTTCLASLPGTDDDIFTITAVDKPDALDNYWYTYRQIFGVGGQLEEFNENLSFHLNGLLKDEILAIEKDNLTFNIISRGYEFEGKCDSITWIENNNRIDLFFAFKGTQFLDGDGFYLRLTKAAGSNVEWNYNTTYFSMIYRGESYAVDAIASNLLDNLYFIVPNIGSERLPNFFKHLLVESINKEMLDLLPSENKLYKYKLSLVSETKRMEKIVLPNVSITQPIVGQKRSVWYYLNQFVELYSPKIKMKDKDNTWVYRNKYKINARQPGDYNTQDPYVYYPLHEIFTDDVYAPEMSLTAPTLREILSRLMVVKDCIPIVRNDVIYAMKISDTHGDFIIDEDNFSFISESINSANYATAFRREYGGAISQKDSAHLVEFLGFRTSGTSDGLMTLSNMYLQTRFPIYKINKLYMCYYKKVPVYSAATETTYNKLVLIKQDITKLVLQNTVRNTLSGDWTNLKDNNWQHITEDEMSQYKVLTLGYSIGSNIISGWGQEYQYITDLLGWVHETVTYIENIMNIMDWNHPFGIGKRQFLDAGESYGGGDVSWRTKMISPSETLAPSNITNKLKSIFFQMDYTAMYHGAVIHSKENIDDDEIISPDNCSSALSILEVDGLFEREKANRFANPEFSFIARFDSPAQMNDPTYHNNILGAEYKNGDDKAIIYHREYQIYDDCVLANFVGTHDYVLKNYFTSVFARYRTYSYAGYEECVSRNENDHYLCFLSDDTCYYETDIGDAAKQEIVLNVLSAFSENDIGDDLNVIYQDKINGGYFTFTYANDPIERSYYSNVNQFVSGYSICFNIRLFDNISVGNYIEDMNYTTEDSNNNTLYVGSQLQWFEMPMSQTDGFIQNIGCYFGHFEEKDFYKDYIHWTNDNNADNLYDKILKLPLKQINPTFSFGKVYNFCKDNKELIDFTLQYELVNQDDNLCFSEWLVKLTDFNNYTKFSTPKTVLNKEEQGDAFEIKFWSQKGNYNLNLINQGGWSYSQRIKLSFSKDSVENDDVLEEGTYFFGAKTKDFYSSITTKRENNIQILVSQTEMKIELEEITEVIKDANDKITGLKIYAVITRTYTKYALGNVESYIVEELDTVITLDRVGDLNDHPDYYEFLYSGVIMPEGADTWATRNSLKYTGHESEATADDFLASVIRRTSPYNYPKTMYILVSDQKIEQNLVYAQFKLNEIPDNYKIADVQPRGTTGGDTFEDIFKIIYDENNRPCIRFVAADPVWETALQDSIESVQYWYYDAEGDGYLHFVFGVNVKDDDNHVVMTKKIYISTIKNRNPIVYNAMHREIGEIMNFANEAYASQYGKQRFVPYPAPEPEEEEES